MIHLAKVSEEVGLQSYLGRRFASNLARSLHQHGGDGAQHDQSKVGHGRDQSINAPSVGVASGYATLEEYAPGRMIVGIGLGR